MKRTIRLALIAAASLLLVGCSPVVALHPADDAKNVVCANVVVHLPDTVAGLPSRQTDAQGTGAWGEPATVLLRCGVPVPAPTATLPCVTVDGIDWLRDDSDDPNFVFTTYGRTPAIEVIVDSDGDPNVDDDGTSGLAALTDLANAVGLTPSDGKCIPPLDTTE
jgi:hypothetical protein